MDTSVYHKPRRQHKRVTYDDGKLCT